MRKLTEARIREEIQKMRFNMFEITGLKQDTSLAIIAGAAIGYKIAMDDVSELIDKKKKLLG